MWPAHKYLSLFLAMKLSAISQIKIEYFGAKSTAAIAINTIEKFFFARERRSFTTRKTCPNAPCTCRVAIDFFNCFSFAIVILWSLLWCGALHHPQFATFVVLRCVATKRRLVSNIIYGFDRCVHTRTHDCHKCLRDCLSCDLLCLTS